MTATQLTRFYYLQGGIQNYLAQEKDAHWKGSLFVFDGRMAVPPDLEQRNNQLPAAVAC